MSSSLQKEQLASSSYQFDAASGIWQRVGSAPIPYTDGSDVERTLNSILDTVQDLSVGSLELQQAITDWPTLYYFSPYRANLLRPLTKHLSGSVLEIGAGCGALTRYLGENAKSVIAVEGAVERAKLCARRCKGLENVQVVCEQFENFQYSQKFDAITLIGVLEYARIYGGGIEGPLNLLKRARELLAPDGVLIIAIENQLGAKYFAGANEDHVNRPWFGVGDLYTADGPVTFGRVEIAELIKDAGFESSKFFIPLPDYKLPVSVLQAEHFDVAKKLGFDPSLFSAMSVSADPHGPPPKTFPLETALRAIGRNDLLVDLANSFLIVANKSPNEHASEAKPIVFHYGSTRKKEYSKETVVSLQNSKIKIQRIPLYSNNVVSSSARYSVDWSDEEFVPGALFIEELFSIVNREEWKIEELIEWAKPWAQLLEENVVGISELGEKKLPSNFLDATPFNLVRDQSNNNRLRFIDLEWIDTQNPELKFVLIRGLLGTLDKITSVAQPYESHATRINYLYLVNTIAEGLGYRLSKSDLVKNLKLENHFRSEATGIAPLLSIELLKEQKLTIRNNDELVSELKSEIEGLRNEISELNQTDKERQRQKFIQLVSQSNDSQQIRTAQKELSLQAKISRVFKSFFCSAPLPRFSLKISSAQKILSGAFLKNCIHLLSSFGIMRFVLMHHGIRALLKIICTWVIIRISGLFDYKYYRTANPTSPPLKDELLLHYIIFGAKEGRLPNSLFDGPWYQKKNKLSEQKDPNPLLHYVLRGSRRGYGPNALFNPDYYRAGANFKPSRLTTDLYHYLSVGAAKALSPHPLFSTRVYLSKRDKNIPVTQDLLSEYLEQWRHAGIDPNIFFDSRYYMRTYEDVSKSGVNPLYHFASNGAYEDRDPCEEFSVEGYLDLYPDVRECGIDPLSHYLEHGIFENRKIITTYERQNEIKRRHISKTPSTRPAFKPLEPEKSEWSLLPSRAILPANTMGVDVIIPVYKGKSETLACIASVLKTTGNTPFRLIVINDHSPDSDLSALLRELAEQKKFILLENDLNLGFVASVNRGMQFSERNDVLLLNSDTEVFSNWLDRMRHSAYSQIEIGTVTPLSNSATICSYPTFCHDHPESFEVTAERIDEIAATVNKGQHIDIPTAVGFCMYIKRQCINQVGYFDVEKFGKGYGEENDFCLRAAQAKWRHIMATDVFVLHYGGTSFAESKADRIKEATEIINREFPRYEQDVQEFIKLDPLKVHRLRIDLARVEAFLSPQKFLFVSHIRGGGTKKHIDHLEASLKEKNVSVLYLESISAGGTLGSYLRIVGIPSSDIPTLTGIDFNQIPELLTLVLQIFEVSHAHVHSMIDFRLSAVEWMIRAFQQAAVSYDVTIHDYAWFCPRLHMVDHTNFYCGGANVQKCQACIERNSSSWGYVNVDVFRDENKNFLYRARKVICPSKDVFIRMRENFPKAALEIQPHSFEIIDTSPCQRLNKLSNAPRRIALLGALGAHKGSEILLKCVADAHHRKLPLEFCVIGYTDNQKELLTYPNVTCVGMYDEKEVYDLIRNQQCDLCWFPVVCPETFSYTFNIALNASLFPVSFNFGAIAERIHDIKWGMTIDASLKDNISAINDILLGVDITERPAFDQLSKQFIQYPDILTDYYNL